MLAGYYQGYYQKNKERLFKNGLWKVSKSFWRIKRQKVPICLWAIYRNRFEEEEEKHD